MENKMTLIAGNNGAMLKELKNAIALAAKNGYESAHNQRGYIYSNIFTSSLGVSASMGRMVNSIDLAFMSENKFNPRKAATKQLIENALKAISEADNADHFVIINGNKLVVIEQNEQQKAEYRKAPKIAEVLSEQVLQ
ncbi:Uncharacterised protein [uncultured archaeon]|nr:Uncharacterised protein [uncultured archaeon]